MQQLERPFTPNQVVLLKKVVSKFKAKVKGPTDQEGERTSLIVKSRPASSQQVNSV